MMNDLEEGERELHTLFGALRRQVARISDGLWSHVDRRLDEDARPVESVSHSKVAGGALLEILNLLTRLFGGGDEGPPPPKPETPESDAKRGE
jgi:hypothetical protein